MKGHAATSVAKGVRSPHNAGRAEFTSGSCVVWSQTMERSYSCASENSSGSRKWTCDCASTSMYLRCPSGTGFAIAGTQDMAWRSASTFHPLAATCALPPVQSPRCCPPNMAALAIPLPMHWEPLLLCYGRDARRKTPVATLRLSTRLIDCTKTATAEGFHHAATERSRWPTLACNY